MKLKLLAVSITIALFAIFVGMHTYLVIRILPIVSDINEITSEMKQDYGELYDRLDKMIDDFQTTMKNIDDAVIDTNSTLNSLTSVLISTNTTLSQLNNTLSLIKTP